MELTHPFELLFSSLSRIYRVAGPQIESARKQMTQHCSAFDPALVNQRLELELEQALIQYFEVNAQLATSLLQSILVEDPKLRRDVLLEMSALCAVIIANDLTSTVKECLLEPSTL